MQRRIVGIHEIYCNNFISRADVPVSSGSQRQNIGPGQPSADESSSLDIFYGGRPELTMGDGLFHTSGSHPGATMDGVADAETAGSAASTLGGRPVPIVIDLSEVPTSGGPDLTTGGSLVADAAPPTRSNAKTRHYQRWEILFRTEVICSAGTYTVT